MQTEGNIARLSQTDETEMRKKIESSEVDALRINEHGEVSLAALRGLFYKYYPMGLDTPYLESPMTEMLQQIQEAIGRSE